MKFYILLSVFNIFVVNLNVGCLIPTKVHYSEHNTQYTDDCWEPIRIHIEYNDTYDEKKLNEFIPGHLDRTEVSSYIRDDIRDHVIYWSVNEIKKFLKVRPLYLKLYFPRLCTDKNGNEQVSGHSCPGKCSQKGRCGPKEIDKKYSDGCYGQEIHPRGDVGYKDTDMVLLIDLVVCNPGDNQNAKSYICLAESNIERPTGAYIQLCLDKILTNFGINVHGWRAVFLHEVFHVLLDFLHGKNYVQQASSCTTSVSKLGKTTIEEYRRWRYKRGETDKKVFLSKLPNLTEFARKHFKCETLKGLELNEDSRFSPEQKYNHFEERLFPDALMSPNVRLGKTITKLEMRALKDTGWYMVDDSYKFTKLTETRGKGCDYATKSCYEYMEMVNFDKNLIYPYCDSTSGPHWGCSFDHSKSTKCSIKIRSSSDHRLPYHYDYYDNYVGTDINAEYCGMVVIMDYNENPDALCYASGIEDIGSRVCAYSNVSENEKERKDESFGKCSYFSCTCDKIDLSYKDWNYTCGKDVTDPQPYGSGTFKVDAICPNHKNVCIKRADHKHKCSNANVLFGDLKMTYILLLFILLVNYFFIM